MPTLLDTHAWVWWVTEDRRLSKPARRRIERAAAGSTLLLSLISVWEVAKRVEKRQLVLDRPITAWLDAATLRPGLELVELSRPVLEESCRLPQPFHGDPAHQMVVATARLHEAVVITRDERLTAYRHVRTAW